jgi:hypothetical protein
VSAATAVAPVLLIFLSNAWIVPAIMMLVMWRLIGLRHPSPLNPYEPLSRGRLLLGVVALLAFVVSFTPSPLRIEDLVRTP